MIKTIDFSQTKITGGFWKEKQDMVRRITTMAVYNRFNDTGRFDAFRCDWKEGMPNRPHYFWDSDVAKWIEGVAYLTELKREPKLERLVDATIDLIEKNQEPCGYFNIVFIAKDKPQWFHDRFKMDDFDSPPDDERQWFYERMWHELYCAGHLMEAAVAYYKATGKRKLLDCMCRYADYIERRFVIEKNTNFSTPGHEEIELALYRLYEATGEERYRRLADHFINVRGTDKDVGGHIGFAKGSYALRDCAEDMYTQAHKPVREQDEAVGHAVRAVYLYCGMADLAYLNGDVEMKAACEKIFRNIIDKRMYITGGIGSSFSGEAFTIDYDLSNIFAYTETCASLGLALFANRMLKLEANSIYSDTIERAIYNGFISSTSLDGKSFFYENPLEIIPYLHTRDQYSGYGNSLRLPITQRVEVFDCSCCPPNIVRFVPSIANLLYGDDGETLYVHQYMQSKTEIERAGKRFTVAQRTLYPENGKVKISVNGCDTRLAVRIPGWCERSEVKIALRSSDGAIRNCENVRIEKGYAYFDLKDGDTLILDFKMKVKLMRARPEVTFNNGRCAVMRGPIVYCMEGVDNGEHIRDIRIDRKSRFVYGRHEGLGVPMLTTKAYRTKVDAETPLYAEVGKQGEYVEVEAKLIPYYAFANRGVTEMQVWCILN